MAGFSLIPPRAREFAALAQLVEAFHPDTQPEEWKPEHQAVAEAAAIALLPYVKRVQEREAKAVQAGRKKAPRRPLPAQSAKRKAERGLRDEVRRQTLERAGHRCEGPAYGLPGACRIVSMERAPLEVHEKTARGTHPGSHLDASVTVALCQFHHDVVTSPSGENRKLAERLGLIVRATT